MRDDLTTDTAIAAAVLRMLDEHGRLDEGGLDVVLGELTRGVNDPGSGIDQEGRVFLAAWLGAFTRLRDEGADPVDTLRAIAPPGFYEDEEDDNE